MRVVKILLEQGAEINARDSNGGTALHLAANSWNLASKILSTLSATTVPSNRIPGQFASVVESSIDVNLERSELELEVVATWSTFERWKSSGIKTIIRLLIEHQADVDIEDKRGETALAKVVRGYDYVKEVYHVANARPSTREEIEFGRRERTNFWLEDTPMIISILRGQAGIQTPL
jgi:hypothetical protein